jgi:hypothetical protein
MTPQRVHFIWNEPLVVRKFESAVSLHSHTDQSREGLACVPKYAERSAIFGMAVARVSQRYRTTMGRNLDFGSSYFLPPLTPAAAYKVEADQIEALGLQPMVSITDHDTVDAPKQLQTFIDAGRVPVSLEWTVPFGAGYFHLGVHNLPSDFAYEILDGLLEVQCSHCQAFGVSCSGIHDARCVPHVRHWMDRLSSVRDVLIVLNHPLWDTCGLGESRYRELLLSFLSWHKGYIHALELNGLRSWDENSAVMSLANQWNLPVISGGDRHGCEPNAVVNLTQAQDFSTFAQEIRCGAPSPILFLGQYRQPLLYRKLKTAWDVLKNAEARDGEPVRWSDRVCVPWMDGRVLPLSSQEWSATLANKSIERPQAAWSASGNAAV